MKILIFCILSSFLILSCDSDSPMNSEMLLQEEPQFSLEEPTPDLEEPPLYLNEVGKEAQIVISDDFESEAISMIYYENGAPWLTWYYRKVRFVAELLQKYFKEVTGTTLKIVTDKEADPNRPQIVLGRSKANAYLDDERNALPPEGFIIRRKGNQISIVGKLIPPIWFQYKNPEFNDVPLIDTGVLFGTVEFIERVLGVRWYFPGELGTVIPKKETISVNDLSIKDAPFYKQRTVYWNPIFLKPEEYASFGEVVSYGFRLGDSTGFGMFHTDEFWKPEHFKRIEDFNKANAVDIRAKYKNGNLVSGYGFLHLNYAEPKTVDFQMQRIHDFFDNGVSSWPDERGGLPNRKYIKYFPPDVELEYHDQSAASQALWITDDPEYKYSKLSNYIFSFAAKLADALKNSEYSSRRLAFASYTGYTLPPKGITIPDNADVEIFTLKGNAALISSYHMKYTKDLIEKWWNFMGKDRNRIYLVEFSATNPSLPLILFPHVMKEWYQFNKDKVTGDIVRGDILDRGSMQRNILNHWLRYKLWWNPDADVDELISQYCKDLFGNGAKAMEEVFKRTAFQHENVISTYWTGLSQWAVAGPGGTLKPEDPEDEDEVKETKIYLNAICPNMYPQPFFDEVNKSFEEAKNAVGTNSIEMKRIDFFHEGYTELENMCAPY